MCPIDDLIKECNKILSHGCKSCGFNNKEEKSEYFTLLCLSELLDIYNIKFDTNYALVNKDELNKIKRMLDDCECV